MSKDEDKVDSGKRRFGGWLPLIIGGVVLAVVYQLGHSSGSRSSVDSENRFVVTYPTPMDPSDDARPARNNLPAPVRNQPIPLESPVNAAPVRNNAAPVRNQPIPLDTPGNAVPARSNAAPVRHQPIPLDSPVNAAPVVRQSVQPIAPVVETTNMLTPMSYTGPPATNVPHPAPSRSVYEQASSDVPKLAPLQPLQPASVYQPPASRTTFREPVMAPAIPPARPAASPLSLNCDCGQVH